MREALEHLIAGEDFDTVLEEYQLNKYELLESLRDEVISHKKYFQHEQKEQLKSIYMDSYSMIDFQGERVMFVSDTHFASKFEYPGYFPIVLDFCHTNGIHYLFHGGDIGDGMIQPGKNYHTPIKQVEHILDVYLEDKKVRQFILGGNHDSKYHKYGIDLLKVLASEKKNVYPLGYAQSYFTIFGYPFSFEHHCTIRPQYRLIALPFTITGHAHKSRFGDDFIKLPTLSHDHHYKDFPAGVLGFIVMDTISDLTTFDLKFSRYSFTSSLEPYQEEAYVYQFVKKC